VTGGDESLAYLLELDGEEIVYEGGFVARFRVKKISPTSKRPHGIAYSLTFHAPDGRRLMGYDNGHGVPHRGGRYVARRTAFDHWHRDETDSGRPYRFVSAERLVADFFDEVARILEEKSHG
jgi:hypothetical protein